MKYEDYAKYEAERLARLGERNSARQDKDHRQELITQLLEVLEAIEGRISSELVAELRDELGRLA